jgi:hypothetical protein
LLATFSATLLNLIVPATVGMLNNMDVITIRLELLRLHLAENMSKTTQAIHEFAAVP